MFRFQRTVAIHKIVFLIILIGHVVIASPFRFDEASNDIQDFVIVNVTNCIRSSMIALMHKRIDEYSRPEDALMPSYYDHELGVERRRCLIALKGDRSLSGNKVCYLYLTPRMANVLPRIYISTGGVTGGPWEEGYFPNDKPVPGKMIVLTGRQKWMYHPPYKPLSSYRDEFVQMMLLTPEHTLDKARIVPNKYHYGHGTVMDFIGNNYKQAKPEELMAKLKIEMAFSNRVFRMNEGCAFQVDYPVPEMDWRSLETKDEHLKLLKKIQADNTDLMHLSADEISEIVYLAYMADGGDMKGYEDACARCPELLKPVTEFKTGIGSRLHQAMKKGGMIKP